MTNMHKRYSTLSSKANIVHMTGVLRAIIVSDANEWSVGLGAMLHIASHFGLFYTSTSRLRIE